jgi:hypothetical protein
MPHRHGPMVAASEVRVEVLEVLEVRVEARIEV